MEQNRENQVTERSQTAQTQAAQTVQPQTAQQQALRAQKAQLAALAQEPQTQAAQMQAAQAQIDSRKLTGQEEKLRSYLERVNGGEDMDAVREDFAREFEHVPVMDIMHVEQMMLQDGAQSKDMKKLCDLHSALFHGRSEGEVISEQSRLKKLDLSALPEGHPVQYFVWENSALEQLVKKIHFLAETSDQILASEEKDGDGRTRTEQQLEESLTRLKKIRTLYSKKEELIMPKLEQVGVVGPTQVMWPVDDEIKKETGRLARELPKQGLPALRADILAVLKRITEMIYKDENILLPVSLKFFSPDDWKAIYRDEYEMGPVFANEIPRWDDAEMAGMFPAAPQTAAPSGTSQPVPATPQESESSGASQPVPATPQEAESSGASEPVPAAQAAAPSGTSQLAAAAMALKTAAEALADAAAAQDRPLKSQSSAAPQAAPGAIIFDGDAVSWPAGRLTIPQLKGLLKVLPVDITFIDPQPENQFYKNTDRIFSRPLSSLGRSTFLCHPAQLRPVVTRLLEDFKNGTRDSFERYIPNPQRPVRVLYLAVRDEEGNYLGAAEIVQDLTDIKKALDDMGRG